MKCTDCKTIKELGIIEFCSIEHEQDYYEDTK